MPPNVNEVPHQQQKSEGRTSRTKRIPFATSILYFELAGIGSSSLALGSEMTRQDPGVGYAGTGSSRIIHRKLEGQGHIFLIIVLTIY
jgi:hypothetical protein